MSEPTRAEIAQMQNANISGQQKKIDKLNNETYKIVLPVKFGDKFQAFEHCILIEYKSIPCFKDPEGNYYPVNQVLTFSKEF